MDRVQPARKRERLDVRISPEQKAQFQQAASLAGCTLTDFVIRSVQSAADETIRNHQVMTLSARDSAAF
ncbi:MAG TPA: DUF1778 domain-containing protein, partial [Nitrolancea sp.]|nr:DUF1778 domain-containing protein [Nitrolancea sp.]